jgi:hypothetical protein
MDDNSGIVRVVGQELVDYSKEAAEFSAQRGLVEELFPYIWTAARRMSLRAVSVWLKEAQNISLSPNTLSRAMRNQKKYWLAWGENIEPAARIFAEAQGMTAENVMDMDGEEFYEMFLHGTPSISGREETAQQHEIWDYEAAADTLKSDWFGLPDEARAQCLVYLAIERRESEAKEAEEEKASAAEGSAEK